MVKDREHAHRGVVTVRVPIMQDVLYPPSSSPGNEHMRDTTSFLQLHRLKQFEEDDSAVGLGMLALLVYSLTTEL